MSVEDQRLIRKYMPTHFFMYDAGLAHALGSVNDALLVDNLLYWNGLGAKRGYVYKTVDEMHRETALTESQQRAAIKRCVDKGILEVKLKGIPAKRHFKLHIKALIKLISSSEILDELDPKKAKIYEAIKERSNTENNQRLIKELNSIYRLYVLLNDEKSSRFTASRALLITDRLQDAGYEMCVAAVRNCASDDYLNGNEDGVFKGSIEYIFKTYENIENLSNRGG